MDNSLLHIRYAQNNEINIDPVYTLKQKKSSQLDKSHLTTLMKEFVYSLFLGIAAWNNS